VSPERSLRTVGGATAPRVEVAGVTDRGPVREENQDHWDAFERAAGGGLAMLLADGMGGHAGGGEAAAAAIAAARQGLESAAASAQSIAAAVDAANAAVAEVRSRLGGSPGTTLVVAVMEHDRAVIANIGDSRAYRIRGGQAVPLTEDHSWVGEQVRAGLLEADAGRHHPRRNVITRAVMGDPVVADEVTVPLQAGDVVMLCSDGVWEPLSDVQLGELFAADAPLERVMEWLCDAALAAGGTDNVTAVAARFAPPPDPPR
jgi:serine/threonine protein phosphatase PrpC